MFCQSCGKQLIPGAAFCQNCGRPAAVQQPSYSPPPAEETLLVMKATRKLSVANLITCHIVFKRNWLALAHQTAQLTARESAGLQASLQAQNLGVMKRSAAQMRFWADFHKRYYGMGTDNILAEDPANQALNYGTIAAVDFACGYSTADEDSSYDHDGTLQLALTTGEVLKFTHQLRHDKMIKELLESLFGPRLRYKK